MPRPSRDFEGQVIDYLRKRGGKAVIKGSALAKELGAYQSHISCLLRGLVSAQILTVSSGKISRGGARNEYVLSPQFMMGDSWRQVLRPLLKKKYVSRASAVPVRNHGNKNDFGAKLAMAQELVAVYEKLKEAQGQALQLQADNQRLEKANLDLEKRVQELEQELNSERVSLRHDANEIAKLELQLRELRAETNSKARRTIFDHRGVQA